MSLGWMVGCWFVCLLILLILFPLVGCFVDLLPQTLLVGTFPYKSLVQSFLAPSSTGVGLFVDARTHTYHTVLFSKDGGIFLGVNDLHWFRITGFFCMGFEYTPEIDTKEWQYFQGAHLFQTIILGIHGSFGGCTLKMGVQIFSQSFRENTMSEGLGTPPKPKICCQRVCIMSGGFPVAYDKRQDRQVP